MPSVALIHSGRSFMPEIAAYQDYFQRTGITAKTLIQPTQLQMEPYEVLWFFMGMQWSLSEVNKKKVIVHEYCSASTPPFAKLKDFLKKNINQPPALRISLSPEHRGIVFPADNVPLIIRKQGVHDYFFRKINCKKDYDFIYSGSALKVRHTDKWLWKFVKNFPDGKIILVGHHEPDIVQQFNNYPNIYFKVPVGITSLPELLAKSRYAVNYVPDVYPFNIQPSTKLLEYCAAGCKIISNRYGWVNNLPQPLKNAIFFIDDKFDTVDSKQLKNHHFSYPEMENYKWDTIFREMRIQSYLKF